MSDSLLFTWWDVLAVSFNNIWSGVLSFVPNLIVAVIIFIVGWFVGATLGRYIAQAIRALKVDNILKSLGANDLVSRAGFNLDSGMFIGGLVKWFIIAIFLVASLDVLGLQQVNMFLREVVLGYLPNVIVAALILVVAALIAQTAQSVITGSARAAQMPSANFMGGVARWAIWIFAIIAALSQLQVAPQLMQVLFTGLVAMLAIAGGLAFGLGGKEAASRYIDHLRKDFSDR